MAALSIGRKQDRSRNDTSCSALQSLGSFRSYRKLLARAGFWQDDFQYPVLYSGRHIVWIYLMRQIENAEQIL